MGNRAVVAFRGTADNAPCLYLHWNGGRASVLAFLNVAKELQLEGNTDGLHTLGEIIRTKFFDGSSVYHDALARADVNNGDNGLYWIDPQWDIVAREHVGRHGEEDDAQKTREIYTQLVAAIEVDSWVQA